MMQNVGTWLKGKKTYFVAALAILYALLRFYYQEIDLDTLVTLILAALGGATLRHGVKTSKEEVQRKVDHVEQEVMTVKMENKAARPPRDTQQF